MKKIINFIVLKLYLIIFIVGDISIWIYQYNLYQENIDLLTNGKSAMCRDVYIGDRSGIDEVILACDYYNEDLNKNIRAWMSPKPIDESKKLVQQNDEVKILYINKEEKTYHQVIYELKPLTIIKNCLFLTGLYLILGFVLFFSMTHNKNRIEREDYMMLWNVFFGKKVEG